MILEMNRRSLLQQPQAWAQIPWGLWGSLSHTLAISVCWPPPQRSQRAKCTKPCSDPNGLIHWFQTWFSPFPIHADGTHGTHGTHGLWFYWAKTRWGELYFTLDAYRTECTLKRGASWIFVWSTRGMDLQNSNGHEPFGWWPQLLGCTSLQSKAAVDSSIQEL